MLECKVVVIDEVNCKIVGLDLVDRKNLVNKFKFEVPGARYQPAVRLGRWDGKVSFFQLSGATYVNLLPDVLDYLVERKYDIDLEDLREYSTALPLELITADTFSHKVWPVGHPVAGQPVVLRDYQTKIVNTFLENTQCIQEIATGAGKTLITAALSNCIERHGRSIVIVPNKDLVRQTEADYINLGLDVGVFFGDRKEFGKTHTICTWQSLHSLQKKTRNGDAPITIQDFLEDVVCVMVDEVHQAKADVLKDLLTGVMGHVPIRWGLTGTVPKEEIAQASMFCSLGSVVGKLGAKELQDQGVLSNCHVNIVQLQDHSEYSNYQSELKYLLCNEERTEYIASLVSKINTSGNSLVLVDRISAGEMLAQLIPNAVFVNGNTNSDVRKDHYDEVADSTNKIIIATYGVAAVGINIPRIFNLVLVEPGKSFVRVIQSIGRGIRKAEDKDHVEIWDVTSTCKFAKRHLTKRKAFYKEAGYPFTVKKIEWK